MSRADNRGRSKGVPHVRLDKSVFHSPAYRACSLAERAMLFEVIELHNGSNNGSLWLSVRDAAKRLGVSDPNTARRALRGLCEKGLLAVSTPGYFTVKTRHATCYRLTFLAANGQGPTGDYRNWQPVENTSEADRVVATAKSKLRCRFSPSSVVKIHTEVATDLDPRCTSVLKTTTAFIEKPQFSPATSVLNNHTHIDCHTHGVAKASSEACKTAAGLARKWIDREGVGAQGRLAGLAGIHPSKLSRFLADTTGRRSLTIEQCERLRDAALSRGHLRAVA